MTAIQGAGPRVVVGVTDSKGSRWALAWAVGAARRYGLPLTVVCAYSTTVAAVHPLPVHDCQREAAEEVVRLLFAEVCGGVPADVPVAAVYAMDLPGRALTETAHAEDLLVIGTSGGLGGGTRRYCARHTRCPLVVVPRAEAAELLGSPVKVARRHRRDVPAL
ncbi:universal stress protein [Plantactinospora siamensis]|uniref:Universal stress protein n=1 Tax=Plantactinospora siamensis TaxID=555372 RepID=A0ABV6P4C7_9ACTN